MRDLAVRLLPDFRRRGRIVRGGIGRIAVLVRIKIFLRLGGKNFADAADRSVSAFVARRNYQFHAIHRQDLFSLRGRARRKTQLHAIAERRADHSVGNPGVAAGRVKNHLAGPQVPVALADADHRIGRAVFHRTSRIEPLRLGINFDMREFGGEALQAQQGRVADALSQVFAQSEACAGMPFCRHRLVHRAHEFASSRASPIGTLTCEYPLAAIRCMGELSRIRLIQSSLADSLSP